jgi:hypothetical protein
MSRVSNLFSWLYGLVLILSLLLLLNCSGTPQIPDQVCEVGVQICDVGSYLCETNVIPDPVCTWVNLACLNLNVLCTADPDTPDYITAQSNLKQINQRLSEWLTAQRDAHKQQDVDQ